mmetsp:Transcript_4049/g.10674  ORF Transcript_4049/g.10674 Transcript_4049/m.10674 type:complete len:299 (+) Transcript_4049:878-1774(+)
MILFAHPEFIQVILIHILLLMQRESTVSHLFIDMPAPVHLQTQATPIMRSFPAYVGGPDDLLVLPHLQQRQTVVAKGRAKFSEVYIRLRSEGSFRGDVACLFVANLWYFAGVVKILIRPHQSIPQARLVAVLPAVLRSAFCQEFHWNVAIGAHTTAELHPVLQQLMPKCVVFEKHGVRGESEEVGHRIIWEEDAGVVVVQFELVQEGFQRTRQVTERVIQISVQHPVVIIKDRLDLRNAVPSGKIEPWCLLLVFLVEHVLQIEDEIIVPYLGVACLVDDVLMHRELAHGSVPLRFRHE